MRRVSKTKGVKYRTWIILQRQQLQSKLTSTQNQLTKFVLGSSAVTRYVNCAHIWQMRISFRVQDFIAATGICFGMLDKIATAEQTLTSTRRRIITSEELRFENATSVDPLLSHVAHLQAFVCTCGIGTTITSVFRQLKTRMVTHSRAEVDHLERLLWGPATLLQWRVRPLFCQ